MIDERRWSLRTRMGGVRVRTVLGAVIAVALALVVASVAMFVSLRSALTEDVRETATRGAEGFAEQLESGVPAEDLVSVADDDAFVQIVDSRGDVVAASEDVEEIQRSLAEGVTEEGRRVDVPFDDDPFLVVTETADTDEGSFTVVVGHTLDEALESSAEAMRLMAIGGPILLAVLGLITWRVVDRALRPVDSMRREVDEITSQHLERRVPVPDTDDEVARLASTMNDMLDRLEEGQRRERRFVSDASHELRSPIAAIRQHVEVALAHPDSISQDELARRVLAEDLRLVNLVEDLLLLARSKEGASEARETVDLDDIVLEEVARVRAVTSKDIETTQVSAGRVKGDRRRLTRLVVNLLENAERHATVSVSVGLSERDGEVILTVDDDGDGIDAADRERIFGRFVRLDDARDRAAGGVGLGLAIVAEVAAWHGGTARAADAPAGGARFEVRLPRSG